ncbi:MAG: DUF4276 family protein [Cylindrospermopsis raciborskii]|uniref:DUF4276 family protein n=1 Tax=Cylindrospermopsis raciborskii TaxID=77022 RepID=UPI003D114C1D
MIRVHIICEGQTEESFVSDVLVPHFSQKGIALYPSLIGKPGHKGGNFKIERLLDDVRNRLKGDTWAYCTTMFDYYGLPILPQGQLQRPDLYAPLSPRYRERGPKRLPAGIPR